MSTVHIYTAKEGDFKTSERFSTVRGRTPPPIDIAAVQPPNQISFSLHSMLGLPRPLAPKGEPNTPFCKGSCTEAYK